VRQYKGSVERRLSDTISASIAGRYGSIDGLVSSLSAANYGIAANRGHFWSARASVELLPTHTGIAILIHGIRQDLKTPSAILPNDADKLALSVAQDLSVVGVTPFGADWKLLLALETARATTTSATDRRDETATANRLLGGVAVSF